MARIFAAQEVGYSDPVMFTTIGRYSMSAAMQILSRLELETDCEIRDPSWKRSGYGALVEVGIPVRLGTIEFKILCSGESILVYRISGNKAKFYDFCRSIREMEFEDAA